jgi:hypothetical protein
MNIEILNWQGLQWEADWGGVKRTGRGESFGAATTQGNSLCSYLYLKPAKHYVSHFIYYVFFLQYQRTGAAGGGGAVGTSGKGEVVGKGVGG